MALLGKTAENWEKTLSVLAATEVVVIFPDRKMEYWPVLNLEFLVAHKTSRPSRFLVVVSTQARGLPKIC